jgi:hypothetical protein
MKGRPKDVASGGTIYTSCTWRPEMRKRANTEVDQVCISGVDAVRGAFQNAGINQ